jgi:hypothetical protein
MAHAGTLGGLIAQTIGTVMATASITEVEIKLKEVDKANEALAKRWTEMMSSPEATSYRAKKQVSEWEQTQLIVDLENLMGKLTSVCLAQQQVLTAITAALKNLNKK